MRHRGTRTFGRAARLQDDDRLVLLGLCGLRHERFDLVELLDVEAENADVVVGCQWLDEFVVRECNAVADVHADLDPELLERARHELVHDRAGVDAGLGDQGDWAVAPLREFHEAGEQTGLSVDVADGVRADRHHSGSLGHFAHPLLGLLPHLVAFTKTGRDHDDAANACTHALLHRLLDVGSPEHDDGHVELRGNLLHGAERLEAFDLAAGGVDGIDGTREPAIDDVAQDQVAGLLAVLGGADHRDRSRGQEAVEIAHVCGPRVRVVSVCGVARDHSSTLRTTLPNPLRSSR